MLYLSEHFHSENKTTCNCYSGDPTSSFNYIGHFLLGLQNNVVLLLLYCKDC